MPAGVRVETARKTPAAAPKKSATASASCRHSCSSSASSPIFVGSFVIFNTFSITVAQRVSEFGMLRTLGASRRQILSSVLIEALAIGLLGAIVGIVAGFLAPRCSTPCSKRSASTCRPPAWCWSRARSIVAPAGRHRGHLLSSLVPALRSTRVPPIAALHAFAPPSRRRGAIFARRLASARPVGLVALAARRLCGSAGGAGAAPRSAAARWSSSSPSRSSARAWCRRWRRSPAGRWSGCAGLTGRLARENAQRNPSRTAITAAALMIGLAAGRLRRPSSPPV